MNPKIKNAILFIVIALVMIAVYVFFIKTDSEQANLVSTLGEEETVDTFTSVGDTETQADSQIAKDFLAVLLSVKNIRLDDSIFSDVAFMSLKDSSILLKPDGSEGRPNPFAPIGADTSFSSASAIISSSSLPIAPESESGSSLNISSDTKTDTINTGSKPAN